MSSGMGSPLRSGSEAGTAKHPKHAKAGTVRTENPAVASRREMAVESSVS